MLASVAQWLSGNLVGSSSCNNFPPEFPSLRSEIDYPVSALDNVQVVFDYNHSMPISPQTEEDLNQLVDIG